MTPPRSSRAVGLSYPHEGAVEEATPAHTGVAGGDVKEGIHVATPSQATPTTDKKGNQIVQVSDNAYSRSWNHSEATGLTRLVIMAICNFSDDDGVYRGGLNKLAHLVRSDADNVLRCFVHLQRAGDISIDVSAKILLPTNYIDQDGDK